jgi:hypothetical protein
MAQAGLAFERQRLKEILLPATKTGSFVKPVVPLNRPTIAFVGRSEWLWQDQL